MGKHLCEIFKNTYIEEHLCTAASELYEEIVWNSFWATFKTISRLSNITKIPVTFKPEL